MRPSIAFTAIQPSPPHHTSVAVPWAGTVPNVWCAFAKIEFRFQLVQRDDKGRVRGPILDHYPQSHIAPPKSGPQTFGVAVWKIEKI